MSHGPKHPSQKVHPSHGPKAGSLRSILALAAGATGLPLIDSADAAIIVDSSLNGTVIGWNTGAGQTRSVSRSLPSNFGNANSFHLSTLATVNGGSNASNYVGVAVSKTGGVLFQLGTVPVGGDTAPAYLAAPGATVGAGIGVAGLAHVNLGFSTYSNIGNLGFSGPPSKYLLFSFSNNGTTNYGWIELLSTTAAFSSQKSAYSATLGDWAYDDTGATITAGQTVPEPASAALAMGGALVAGAAGLRRWRKERAARSSGSQAS